MADWERYTALTVVPVDDDGVLEVRLGGAGEHNVIDRVAHSELAWLWRDVESDTAVRCVIVRGDGKNLSAGGDLDFILSMADDYEIRVEVLKEARQIVTGILDCTKPIVSVLHGACIGAGLIPALLADVSVAAKDAMIMDAHTRAGLVAGDHSAAIWPLLCGMAKAKDLLLINEPLSGEEAERIGLVSRCVDASEVQDAARSIAAKLAKGSPSAVRWTKHALNHWLRAALPAFETSLALEFVGIAGPDVREGVAAIRERRPPRFAGPA